MGTILSGSRGRMASGWRTSNHREWWRIFKPPLPVGVFGGKHNPDVQGICNDYVAVAGCTPDEGTDAMRLGGERPTDDGIP